MLISVHIPKTGGSSFKTLLDSHFGDKVYYDYNDRPMAKSTITRKFLALSKAISALAMTKKYECVHGHFMPIKFSLLKRKSLAIWFRDPAERIASRFYYMKRNLDQNSVLKNKYFNSKNISLKEFCSIEHYQNLYKKYIWGVKLDDFDFIGISENFENSIKVFRRKYQVSPLANLINKNINPQKNTKNYNLNNKLREFIYNKNSEDIEIYFKAVAINKRLEDFYLR